MKYLITICLLLMPSIAMADRLGSLRSGADVLLTTQTASGGSSVYPATSTVLADQGISAFSVGIGTASPSADLHIFKYDPAGILIENTDSTPSSVFPIIAYKNAGIVGGQSSLDYRVHSINSGPPNNYSNEGGFLFRNYNGDEIFKLDEGRGKFHINGGGYATANLNVNGNAIIGASLMFSSYTASDNGLLVQGTIKSKTGYDFPDGTTQTTAATGGGSGTTIWVQKNGVAVDNAVSTMNYTSAFLTTSSPSGEVTLGIDPSSVTVQGPLSASAPITLTSGSFGIDKSSATLLGPAPTTTNIPEGNKLYFTTSRATSSVSANSPLTYTSGTFDIDRSSFTLKGPNPTTTTIPEGNNLYYTTARATTAVSGSAPIVNTNGAISIDKSSATLLGPSPTTTAIPEGNNLYYTVARSTTIIIASAPIINTNGTISIDKSSATLLGPSPTTASIPENTNLYYTVARTTTVIVGSAPIVNTNGTISIDKSSATLLGPSPTTSAIPEGTNLYYTTARATTAVSGSAPIVNTNGVISISNVLPGGATSYIGNQNTLQTGTSFYVGLASSTAIQTGAITLNGTLTTSLTVGTTRSVLLSEGPGAAPSWGRPLFNYTFNPEQARSTSTTRCAIQNSTNNFTSMLLCDDTAVEDAAWSTILSPYNGQTLYADVLYTMTSATSGNVLNQFQVYCASATAAITMNTIPWPAPNSLTVVAPATAGFPRMGTVSLGTVGGSCVDGSLLMLRFSRLGASASDTATGDQQVLKVRVYE